MRLTILPVILLMSAGTAAPAHETWLEPKKFQITLNETLEADIRNGENFSGFALSYLPAKQQELSITLGNNTVPVEGRMGDRPAVAQSVAAEGLAVVTYVSTMNKLRYTDAEKFRNFVTHKGFPETLDAHAARGLPETGFTEGYTRFSKALVAVGDVDGEDSYQGLETEFVALDNPYADDFDGTMDLDLYYQDELRLNAQVEVFDRAPDGTVSTSITSTNAAGHAQIAVQPGHTYLVDAVVIREPSEDLAEETGIVWETLWAALTFAVPE